MKTNRPQDQLYSQALSEIADFEFDDHVATVFADMINRSVPGYGNIVGMLGIIAGRYAQNHSRCYDLGCSLGAATLSMRRHIRAECCEIIAIDNSEAMLQRCQTYIDMDQNPISVTLEHGDILSCDIQNASVVVLNFTLQFIPPEERDHLIQRIWRGLKPGGALILSEKFRSEDDRQNQWLIDLHHDFKRAQGYSDLEISQKRSAIEHVMIIDTPEKHNERLLNAGFSNIEQWFKCYNFGAWLAIK